MIMQHQNRRSIKRRNRKKSLRVMCDHSTVPRFVVESANPGNRSAYLFFRP